MSWWIEKAIICTCLTSNTTFNTCFQTVTTDLRHELSDM